MDCEFKVRSSDQHSDLKTTHVFSNPNIYDFCSVKQPPPPGSFVADVPGCSASFSCPVGEYCDKIENSGAAQGTCKRKLSENRECVGDEMCKFGLECRLTRFERTMKCVLKADMGSNYELGSDLNTS